MNKISKEEFFYWVGQEGLEPSWLADIMISMVNGEYNQESVNDLKSEIKRAFKESEEASDEYWVWHRHYSNKDNLRRRH